MLDAGVLIAESRGDGRVRALIRDALLEGTAMVVPPIVVTETYRGNARDVRLNKLMRSIIVPDVKRELAEVAGRLLTATGGSNAADAQVVAEALRQRPCALLTSDPDDILFLLGPEDQVRVLDIRVMRWVR